VRFSNFNSILNRKKGISSIVGGIFFLVLMTSGFTVYYVALDSQSQMLDTQQVIADFEVAKIREKFVVAASSDPGDNYRLSVNVINTGNNVIKIADIWIVNKTDVGEPAERHDLDYRDVFIPVGYTGNIVNNTVLYLDDPETYDIKVISTVGTIKTVEHNTAGGSNVLDAKLFAIPPDVRIGENATLTLYVTNRGTVDTVTQVAPDPLVVNPDRCGILLDPIVVAPIDLAPTQSTVFIWQCTLFGTVGEEVDFSTTARGMLGGSPIPSNLASDVVTIREDKASGGDIILNDDLLGRPDIFLIYPSPFGNDDDDERGLWGVNVVNPTPFPMNVTKVTISLISPRAQSNDQVFYTSQCNAADRSAHLPTLDSEWSCPANNQLMWKNTVNPETINAFSMSPFMTEIEPGELAGSSIDLETVIVQADVTTTLGQFGKAGYSTSMDNVASSIPNVFLTTDPSNPITPMSNVYINKTGMIAGQTETLHAVLADFETSSPSDSFQIWSDAKLIINVPKNWVVSNPSSSDFTIITRTINTQTQIIGELNSPILNGGKVLSFDITPPCVPNTQMFIMYVLADGSIDAIPPSSYDFSLGPLAEIILQVLPDLIGCPPT